MSEICVSVEHIFIILWFDWDQFLLEVRRCDYYQQTRSLGGTSTNHSSSSLFPCHCSAPQIWAFNLPVTSCQSQRGS